MEILYLLLLNRDRRLLTRYSDKKLIDGIRHQDSRILRYIYRVYFDMVSGYVTNNSGSEDDASDVFQETILIIYDRIIKGELKLETDLKGYFFGISKLRWQTALRKRRNHIPFDTDIIDDADEGYDNDNDINEICRKIISRAMEKIDDKGRVVMLMAAKGDSNNEIAKVVNFPGEEAVRKKKQRCREELIKHIKEDPDYKESYFR